MVRQSITPSELARRMGIRKQEMTRIMDLAHATKIDTIAAGLEAVDKSLNISVE